MSLSDFIEALKSGDLEALGDAYQLYHEPLTDYLRWKLGSYSSEAEDLASDTILENLPKIARRFNWQKASPNEDPIRPLLYKAAARKASDFLRKRKRFVPLQQAENIKDPDDFTEREPARPDTALMDEMLERLKLTIKTCLSVKEAFRWMILTAPYMTNSKKAEILGVKESSLSQLRKRLRGKIMDEFKKQMK